LPIVNFVVANGLGGIDEKSLKRITQELREIVANALSSPQDLGGELTAEDIEVFIDVAHHCNPPDKYGIKIQISALEFPERARTIQERTDRIRNCLRPMIPGQINFFVFATLTKGAFSES
jgi:hypothetical protein